MTHAWELKYRAQSSSTGSPGTPSPPSPFVVEALAALATAGVAPGTALDLAMGEGRHAFAAARAGWRVLGLDVAPTATERVKQVATRENLLVHPIVADALALPFRAAAFDLIIVTKYLERGLAPSIAAALRPGGHLIFETFTVDQPALGWGPKNPEFLLARGELERLFPSLRTVIHREQVSDTLGALASLLARA